MRKDYRRLKIEVVTRDKYKSAITSHVIAAYAHRITHTLQQKPTRCCSSSPDFLAIRIKIIPIYKINIQCFF